MPNSILVGGRSAAADLRSTVNVKFTAAAINLRDNTKFVKTFDESKLDATFKPTRTLVVGQNPAPGVLVPVGTPVDLKLTVKDLIPIDGFKEINPKVLEKFAGKSVRDVTDSYRNTEVQKVLDRAGTGDYDALSTADKAVVNDYIRTQYGVDAAADAAGAKNVYDNVKFLNDL